jgi:hypothetical protein
MPTEKLRPRTAANAWAQAAACAELAANASSRERRELFLRLVLANDLQCGHGTTSPSVSSGFALISPGTPIENAR